MEIRKYKCEHCNEEHIKKTYENKSEALADIFVEALFDDLFDTEKSEFAQTRYFSGEIRKFNFRGAQEPRHATSLQRVVLDNFKERHKDMAMKDFCKEFSFEFIYYFHRNLKRIKFNKDSIKPGEYKDES